MRQSVKNIICCLRRFFGDIPLRNKFVLAFLFLALIPVMLIGFLSFSRSRKLLEIKIGQYTTDILRESGKNIEIYLNEINRLSYQLISDSTLQKSLMKANYGFDDEYQKIMTTKEIDNLLMEAILPRKDIIYIAILSNSGMIYKVKLSFESPILLSDQKYEVEKEAGSLVWLNTDAEHKTIPAARVVNNLVTQTKMGFVLIHLRESGIFNIYKDIKFYNSGELYIVNREGKIVSHSNKELLDTQPNKNPYMHTVLRGGKSGFFIINIQGKNNYVTYTSIADTGWKIVSVIPAIEYEKEIISLRNWTVFIAFFCWLLAVTISFYLSSGITKPIRTLSSMMKKVESGNFSVYIKQASKDEVGMLSSHFNSMVRQIDKLIHEVYQEQLLSHKAELKSLRMQINPHFLYNSLESINWMARINQVPDIGIMAKALGDLMKASISGEDFITLDEELKGINDYLTIQKYRYGDKFDVEMDISNEILLVNVPKLILQPLVENAIVHGVENKVGKGSIEIQGYSDEGLIIIHISDNGAGIEKGKIEAILKGEALTENGHASIGLVNVDRRIKLYYGKEYGMSIHSEIGKGTTVTLAFPYPKEQNSYCPIG